MKWERKNRPHGQGLGERERWESNILQYQRSYHYERGKMRPLPVVSFSVSLIAAQPFPGIRRRTALERIPFSHKQCEIFIFILYEFIRGGYTRQKDGKWYFVWKTQKHYARVVTASTDECTACLWCSHLPLSLSLFNPIKVNVRIQNEQK